jgi:hypothetical protein
MELNRSLFNEVLEMIDNMPLEEQYMIIEIIENRYKEKMRDAILRNAQESLQEYKKGIAKRGTVDDLIKDLESD